MSKLSSYKIMFWKMNTTKGCLFVEGIWSEQKIKCCILHQPSEKSQKNNNNILFVNCPQKSVKLSS